jgi:hypothetical protein
LDTLRTLTSGQLGGAAAADSSLAKGLTRTRALLAALIKDIKAHPLRYIKL